MPTIATLTEKADGSFEGNLATLNVSAPIALVPNGRKMKDSEPVINTDRRTYHVELRATAAAYMASISWTYPADELIMLRQAEAEAARRLPVASGIDLPSLNFGYRLKGDKPRWRPTRVFDDGRQLYVEFAAAVATADMPPLFVIGESGAAELVNYRVQGRYMIVDRLFDRAELRLVTGKSTQTVRIEREGERRRRSPA